MQGRHTVPGEQQVEGQHAVLEGGRLTHMWRLFRDRGVAVGTLHLPPWDVFNLRTCAGWLPVLAPFPLSSCSVLLSDVLSCPPPVT